MYLSRLILNPASRRVQREIAEPYEMHRSVMQAFAEDLAPGADRVLFRADEHPSYRAPALLVQSRTVPDWSWLAEPNVRAYLLAVAEPNPAIKSFELNLTAGQVLSFRLLANPTVKRDGKRLGLYCEEEQMRWLVRKAAESGCRVRTAHASHQTSAGGPIHKNGTTHDLNLLAVQFDGVLQVLDGDRLCQAVRDGIGSGKGFGFGLLSLAPAR
jgi:CRISPR system Cascade subunit CasE